MENIEIIILNVIVLFCFFAFFVSTFRAFEEVGKKGVDYKAKRGIISRILSYFESLF
ncbi:hypothetical protein [Flavobacterium sp.]|uniref:hypothetical protein n=1 Tax=Flavobacterium sp. TaxID=239 RepID=UPI00286D1C64|nr:hypothetical protein [Flavobacterium sp.]